MSLVFAFSVCSVKVAEWPPSLKELLIRFTVHTYCVLSTILLYNWLFTALALRSVLFLVIAYSSTFKTTNKVAYQLWYNNIF